MTKVDAKNGSSIKGHAQYLDKVKRVEAHWPAFVLVDAVGAPQALQGQMAPVCGRSNCACCLLRISCLLSQPSLPLGKYSLGKYISTDCVSVTGVRWLLRLNNNN